MVYDEKYGKLYDTLLARKETRTTSTLTIATIASSASLLLFIFYFQAPMIILEDTQDGLEVIPDSLKKEIKNIIPALGILFPIIGIFYHDITYRTITKFDNKILNILILIDSDINERDEIANKIIIYDKMRGYRAFLLYFLLIIPILGWMFYFGSVIGIILDFVIFVTLIFLVLHLSKIPKLYDSKIPKLYDSEVPDFLKDKLDSKNQKEIERKD